MVVHLDSIKVKFKYQGHRVKATFVKLIILTVGYKIHLLEPTYGSNMIIKVISRSRLFQGQGYFQVNVIPESNCKCLDFCPETGGGPSTECILVQKAIKWDNKAKFGNLYTCIYLGNFKI